MKVIWLDESGTSHTLPKSAIGEESAEVPAPCTCKCNRVAGTGKHIAPDDRHYEAEARCAKCGALRGKLQAWPSTLFGLREDEAIGRLGIRIY